MNRIASESNTEEMTTAEARGYARKAIEREFLDYEPNKIQLNDIMLVILVVMAAAISFTDFTLSFTSIKNFTALTAFLYVVTSLVYRNRYSKGKQRGKNDADFVAALEEYRTKVKDIYDSSLAALVPDFCKEYKLRELREYRESLLTDIEMSYEEYKSKYWGLSNGQIRRLKCAREIKRTLIKCNNAKPIKLVPGLIFNERGEIRRDKLVGQSGKERERFDKRSQLISRAAVVLFGGTIAINILFDFSILTVIQWFVRMLPVVFAMVTGEDGGFCCIAVTETNFKRDQTSIINLFFEWIKEKKKAEKEIEERKNDAEQ